MGKHDFEKRMELLKKSYDRLPSSFDPDEVLQKIEKDAHKQEIPIAKSNPFKQKIVVWAVSMASIFLFGIITATFVMDGKSNLGKKEESDVNEGLIEWNEEFQETYQTERERRRKMLNMDEKLFYSLSFIKIADMIANIYANENHVSQLQIGKEELEGIYEDIFNQLKLPSEMLLDLFSNPLSNDEAASLSFMTEFREKVHSMIELYNALLKDGQVQDEIRSGMGSQNIQQITILEHTVAQYGIPKNYKAIRNALHENVHGYFEMLIGEPYLVNEELIQPLEHVLDEIWRMEEVLVNQDQNNSLYPIMEGYYMSIFETIVKGSEASQVFDENGVVKAEYQQVWRYLERGVGTTTPTVYFMHQIVKEMEASAWRHSETWDTFNQSKIEDMLMLARNGELEKFMPNGDLQLVDATLDLPDKKFSDEVEILYYDFAKSHDLNVLRDATQFHVLGVYDFANKREDPETMWHLLDKSFGYPKDEFIHNWKKGVSFFHNATQISFSAKQTRRVGSDQWAYIQISSSIGPGHEILMTLPEDGIWRMQENLMTPEGPEGTPNDATFQLKVYGLYERLKAHGEKALKDAPAIEIIGLYYFTEELQDFETQYMLLDDSEFTIHPSKEDHLANAKSNADPKFKLKDYLAELRFVESSMTDYDGNELGHVYSFVNKTAYPWVDPIQGFWMKNSSNGWRIVLTPNH